MRIRRNAVWAALTILAVVILVWFVARPASDPIHRGKRLSVWFDQLYRARTTSERDDAREAFQAMGATAVPFLVDRLQNRDSRWKKKYERFYFTHSRRFPEWIAARLPVPQPDKEWIRANAATTLGLLGDKARPAMPALARALADESRGVQYSVAQTLRGLGAAAREVLPTIVELLRVPDPYTAGNAGAVIVSIAQGAPEAPALVASLLKEEDTVKIRALGVLSKLGDDASSVESKVETLLASTNASVRFAAVTALWDIFPSRHIELLPLFEEFANRTDIELRETGSYRDPWGRPPPIELRELIGDRLARMQPLTERGAELLGTLLHNGRDDYSWRVITALGGRGLESSNAVPAVVKVMGHNNPRVAAKAAEVLGRIADGQASVGPALENAAHHPQKMVRDAAEESLQRIESKNK